MFLYLLNYRSFRYLTKITALRMGPLSSESANRTADQALIRMLFPAIFKNFGQDNVHLVFPHVWFKQVGFLKENPLRKDVEAIAQVARKHLEDQGEYTVAKIDAHQVQDLDAFVFEVEAKKN